MNDEEDEYVIYKSHSEQVEYKIKFKLHNNKIHIKMKENNELVPYTYEGKFTRDNFNTIHKIFRCPDSLEEIFSEVKELFKLAKFYVNHLGLEEYRYIYFKVEYFEGEESTDQLELKRKMVKNKDEYLINLYNKHSKQINQIEEIKKLIKRLKDNDPIKKAFLDALDE